MGRRSCPRSGPGSGGPGQPAKGWASWPILLLCLSCALAGLAGCESTALTIDDPNEINVVFDPEFIEPGRYEEQVGVRFLGVEDSTAGPPTARFVSSWYFGDGLSLSAWEFHSDFSLTIGIKRFADAAEGRRTLTLEIHNGRGSFLARGSFTVL